MKNDQTYQYTVIWLRIMNRQVAHIQTMAITVAREVLPRTVSVQARTKFGQPPFQDLAPTCKQPLRDNNLMGSHTINVRCTMNTHLQKWPPANDMQQMTQSNTICLPNGQHIVITDLFLYNFCFTYLHNWCIMGIVWWQLTLKGTLHPAKGIFFDTPEGGKPLE